MRKIARRSENGVRPGTAVPHSTPSPTKSMPSGQLGQGATATTSRGNRQGAVAVAMSESEERGMRSEGWGQYSPMGRWHYWRWSRLDFGRWEALCGQTAPRCAFGDRPLTLLHQGANGRPVCAECRRKAKGQDGKRREEE